jgi:hypothetical protein
VLSSAIGLTHSVVTGNNDQLLGTWRIPQPPDGLEPTSGGPSANSATYTKWTDYGILRGRTHPRVSFYFRDAFLDGDSRPAESLIKGDRENASF